ncbi:MAG: metal-sensing transcriptional repressor [Oscillospiraceae bacterium]|nr:metal-sensing transcriptional repressor [Oscillospiraceae bacterium]
MSENEKKKDCCCRKKDRDERERKAMLNRLARIEGQVRGIRGMVENDVYCVDILTQVMAVQSALNGFNKVLLGNHIKSCVTTSVQKGEEDKINELVETIHKLMK